MGDFRLFYEDNRKVNTIVLTVAIVLTVCTTTWTALILSYMLPMPEELEHHTSLAGLIQMLVILAILWSIAIILFLYRFVSKASKYVINITEEEFIFDIPIENRSVFHVADLKLYDIVQVNRNVAKIRLTFKDDFSFLIKTRKYTDLVAVLEHLRERNPYLG